MIKKLTPLSFLLIFSAYGMFDSNLTTRQHQINIRLNGSSPVPPLEDNVLTITQSGVYADPATRKQETKQADSETCINFVDASKSSPGGTIALELIENLFQVRYINANCVDYSEEGILVNAGTIDTVFQNINIINSGTSGTACVELRGTAAQPIEKCIFENITVADTSGSPSGFNLSHVKNCIFNNCRIINCTNDSDGFIGFRLGEGTEGNVFADCSVTNCVYTGTDQSCSGFFANESIDNTFLRCTIQNLESSSDEGTRGFDITASDCIKILDCRICDLSSTENSCFGCSFDNCNDCLVENSNLISINASGGLIDGIGFSVNKCSNIVINNCSATDVSATGSGHGFSLIDTFSSTLHKNKSMNNKDTGFIINSSINTLLDRNIATNSDVGFALLTSGTDTIFTNNFASNNLTANYTGISNVLPLDTPANEITTAVNVTVTA